MPNIHTPERQPNEARDEYAMRRAASRLHAERISLTGAYWPGKGVNSREQQRDDMRKSGSMGKRKRFADVLMAHWARQRSQRKNALA